MQPYLLLIAREKPAAASVGQFDHPSARTLTYEPGASPIGRSAPSPGWRAGTAPPAYFAIQLCQDGHQEPGRSVAPASHSSGVGGVLSFCQCPYLPPGGLTTPAMCPEADNTNL